MIGCGMQQLSNNINLNDFIRKNDVFIRKVMDSDILIKPINVRNTVSSLTSYSSESLSNNDIFSKITAVRNLTESFSLNETVAKELIDNLCLALIDFKKEESYDFAKYLALCSAEGKYPWHIDTMMEGHGFYSDYYKRNDRNELVINEHSLYKKASMLMSKNKTLLQMASDGKNINDIMSEYNLNDMTKKERETLEIAAICGKFRERIKNGESFQRIAEEQGIRVNETILKLIAIAIENGHPHT